jgi:hypothetical protein
LSNGRAQINLWTLMGNTERDRLAVLEANELSLREVVRLLPPPARRNQPGAAGSTAGTLLNDLAERTRSQAAVSRQLSTAVADRFLPQSEARLQEILAQYVSLLVGIARGADPQRIEQEGSVVVQDFESRGIDFMIEVTRLVLRHLDAVARSGMIDPQEAMRDFAEMGRPGGAAPAPSPRP